MNMAHSKIVEMLGLLLQICTSLCEMRKTIKVDNFMGSIKCPVLIGVVNVYLAIVSTRPVSK